jgi:hypothetical protein
LFRGVAAAALSVLGLTLMADAVQAAHLNDSQGDVVTYDEFEQPITAPRADITVATAEYRPGGDEIGLSLSVAEQVDPRTDPNWADGASVVGWTLDTNGDDNPDFGISYVVTSAGGLRAGVVDLTNPNSLLCMARSATYATGTYSAVIDSNCIGAPTSFKWGAAVIYDTDAADENAPVVVDAVPDTDALAGPVVKPPPPAGHWLVGSDGGIFAHNAPFLGSTGDLKLNKPIVGMAADPDGRGYWFVASDGGVFSYEAPFLGSTGHISLNKPIVGMAATPSGRGYWMVATDGGIFAFGDAGFFGSTGDINLNQPIVGMAATPTGKGYWLVASDGGIFSFGDAAFHGSTGHIKLNQPIVGMAAGKTGNGYWFVARDGGVFSFGDAPFLGSATIQGQPPGTGSPVVGMAAARDGKGYTVVRANGLVMYRGSAIPAPSPGGGGPLPGSVTGPLNHPIVGIAATV